MQVIIRAVGRDSIRKMRTTTEAAAPSNSSSYFNEAAKKKILIVDDDDDILFTIQSVLKENGLDVDSFNRAPSALENFMPDVYTVAILDIKMPEMNGFELYEKIREIDSKVRIIFLTAVTEMREYEGFRKKVFPKWGERHFVQKPIENEDLIERVNMMIVAYSNLYYSNAQA
jgi:DNA-binding response OmpR family regulator